MAVAVTFATATEKKKAIERELNYRRFVYKSRVAKGRMTQQQADKQIKIFEEIRDDYIKMEENERLI